MDKNQFDMTKEQIVKWNDACDNIIMGIIELCELFELNKLEQIKGYDLPESLDEYDLKFIAMKVE